MRALPQPPLLVVTDRHQLAGGITSLGGLVEKVLAAGCRWVSLREKDLSLDEQLSLVRTFMSHARRTGACLTVHGSPEIAHHASADGVHLSQDANAKTARALLGAEALIGQSVHTREQALSVDPAVIDYIVAGPAFITASKPGYGPALCVEGLEAITKVSPVPVIAIGGIEVGTVQACLEAGAAGIAVMGGVMRTAHPEAVIAALLERFAFKSIHRIERKSR